MILPFGCRTVLSGNPLRRASSSRLALSVGFAAAAAVAGCSAPDDGATGAPAFSGGPFTNPAASAGQASGQGAQAGAQPGPSAVPGVASSAPSREGQPAATALQG